MGLTELFNEWIVERGSAKVQEKHIAFFRDQLSAADKKTSLLEKKITELEAENEKLKSSLGESRKENEILRSKIQEHKKPTNQTSHSDLLEEVKVNILLFLSTHDEAYAHHCASALKIGLPVAQFHLEELQDAEMVNASYSAYDEPSWYLAQGGRKYLVRNNLIT